MNRFGLLIILLSGSSIAIHVSGQAASVERCTTLETCGEFKRAEFQQRGTVGMLIHPLAVTSKGHGRWRVKQVMPGGPAATAGLRAEDVLTSWNEHPLPRDNDSGMTKLLRSLAVGEEIVVELSRGGKQSKARLVAEGPSPEAVEYWLLLYVRENYSEEQFVRYEASVEQRLVQPDDR